MASLRLVCLQSETLKSQTRLIGAEGPAYGADCLSRPRFKTLADRPKKESAHFAAWLRPAWGSQEVGAGIPCAGLGVGSYIEF